MNMYSWKSVWEGRTRIVDQHTLELFERGPDVQVSDFERLTTLLILDGYDEGAGRVEVADWNLYVTDIVKRLEIKGSDTVFEVGCGAGAFLYVVEKTASAVGGIDLAPGLIDIAKKAIPTGEFGVMEAKALPTTPKYDHVTSVSVFQYFNVNEAAEVLRRMISKARISVAVLDVPDALTECESEKFRASKLGSKRYAEKYKLLKHTYFDREWFAEQARNLGLVCEILDSRISFHAQNRYRFGCIIRK